MSMGALNLSIALLQLIFSLGDGPLDEVFGGGICLHSCLELELHSVEE